MKVWSASAVLLSHVAVCSMKALLCYGSSPLSSGTDRIRNTCHVEGQRGHTVRSHCEVTLC